MTGTRILIPLTMSLLLGVSAAAAQSGSTEQPKKPVRQVGETSWPSMNDRKDADDTSARSKKIDAGQTTGSATTSKANKDPLALQSQEDKKDSSKSNADASNADANKSDASTPTATKADAAKSSSDAKPQELGINKSTTDSTAKTDAVQSTPGASSAQTNAATGSTEAKSDAKADVKGAASIRLGTNAEGRVAVNDDQRRQVSSALRRLNVRPVSNVSFSVRVGTVVPRNVRLTTVSTEFVNVLPQFRGYSLFTTRDEIVIVEPGTLKIVALIPTHGSATATRPERSRTTSRTTKRSVTTARSTTGATASDEVMVERRRPVIIERTITYPQRPVVIERRFGPRIIWEDD